MPIIRANDTPLPTVHAWLWKRHLCCGRWVHLLAANTKCTISTACWQKQKDTVFVWFHTLLMYYCPLATWSRTIDLEINFLLTTEKIERPLHIWTSIVPRPQTALFNVARRKLWGPGAHFATWCGRGKLNYCGLHATHVYCTAQEFNLPRHMVTDMHQALPFFWVQYWKALGVA